MVDRKTWSRPYLLAWAYFIVALLPVLGLLDNTYFRNSFVADHFQYLASMGPSPLAGAGIVRGVDRIFPDRSWVQSTLAVGMLLLLLGSISWQRCMVFESKESLWQDTLTKNPGAWAAYNNLANALLQKGKNEEARAYYQKSLEINPYDAAALGNLGLILLKKGEIDQAMSLFQRRSKSVRTTRRALRSRFGFTAKG